MSKDKPKVPKIVAPEPAPPPPPPVPVADPGAEDLKRRKQRQYSPTGVGATILSQSQKLGG